MTNESVYRATGVGRVAGAYRELEVPSRPCFVRDLLAVPLPEGGVHFLGGEEQTLDGGSIAWMMTELVPLLDGSRTLDELATALPDVAPTDLSDVLHLLQMHGLLERGEDDRAGTPVAHAAQQAFFSRYLRLTGLHSNRREAHAALATLHAVVIGDGPAADIAAELLIGSGVVELTRGADHAVDGGLAVVVGAYELQQRVLRRGGTAALLFVDPSTGTVGPLTVRGSSACPTCVRLQAEAPDDARELAPVWQRALGARAVQHAIAFATGLYQPMALEHVERWNPQLGTTQLVARIARLPGCPDCGTPSGSSTKVFPSGHVDSAALLFHGAAVLQPWHVKQPSGMRAHLTQSVAKLQANAHHEISGARRLDLGAVEPAERAGLGRVMEALRTPVESALHGERRPPSPLDATALAALLRLTFGGKALPLPEGGRRFVRVTASAGNLGSPEAYVVVRDVEGLKPGVYHYLLASDGLEVIREGDVSVGLRACFDTPSAGHEIARADAVVLLVSAVARVCSKYQARGYTYALLDAGLATHRLELLGRQLGIAVCAVDDFDDVALAELVGADGLDLAPSLAIALSGADS